MKKKIFISLLILGALAGVYSFYLYNKPVQSLKSAKADLAIQANELLLAFQNDETKANALYLDKVVEVNGTVHKIETEGDKSNIFLSTDDPLSSVICEMEDGQSFDLNTGDKVSIKGLCTGYLMDVVIVKSVINKN